MGQIVADLAESMGLEVVYRHGTILVPNTILGKLLDSLRMQNIRVLGLEGFRVEGQSLIPDMEAIADFSDLIDAAPEVSVDAARMFLLSMGTRSLLYEVITDEE